MVQVLVLVAAVLPVRWVVVVMVVARAVPEAVAVANCHLRCR
jgi:hypothetical protein